MSLVMTTAPTLDAKRGVRRAFFSPRFAVGFGKGWLIAGFVFLYMPIVALIVYSFNASPLPTVWAGFTLDWYVKLIDDREMLAGLWLSLKIAFITATGSVVLGSLGAFSLVKYRRFTGRTFSRCQRLPGRSQIRRGLLVRWRASNLRFALRSTRIAARWRQASATIRLPCLGVRGGVPARLEFLDPATSS